MHEPVVRTTGTGTVDTFVGCTGIQYLLSSATCTGETLLC